jgi:hypothetical protein
MKVTLSLSDRANSRHFTITSDFDYHDILQKAVGQRYMSARLAERQVTKTDKEIGRVYEVMVHTGPPLKGGGYPFKNIRAYLSL